MKDNSTRGDARGASGDRVLTIHIGMNKTGSTSLQHFLYANREVLRKKGVLYPSREELLFQDAHHRLAGAVLPTVDWKVLREASSSGGDDPETMISLLRSEISSAPSCRDIVVSSELFAVGNPERAIGYLSRIREVTSTRIVVYIRNYVDFLESLLAHQITCSGFDGEMVTDDFRREFCLQHRGHYRKIIEAWARGFGKENIEVRVLEEKQLRGGNIISDFLSLFGLEMDETFRDIGTRNVSLGRNGLEFMMFLNSLKKRGLVEEVESKVIRWMLRKIPDNERSSLFSSGLRHEIREWSREEYSYLAREFPGREDGILFLNAAGKDIPGGETYQGLDPEFAVRASHIITRRALEQGAFSRIKRKTAGRGAGEVESGRRLKRFILRFPGVAALRRLLRT